MTRKSVTFIATGGLEFGRIHLGIPHAEGATDDIFEFGAHTYRITIERIDAAAERPAPPTVGVASADDDAIYVGKLVGLDNQVHFIRDDGVSLCGTANFAAHQHFAFVPNCQACLKEAKRIEEMRTPVDAWSVKDGYMPAAPVAAVSDGDDEHFVTDAEFTEMEYERLNELLDEARKAQPAADATAQRSLEERLTSGKPEDRVIERGELQDAARLVAEGKVQPIEGKDYYVMPETAQRVRLTRRQKDTLRFYDKRHPAGMRQANSLVIKNLLRMGLLEESPEDDEDAYFYRPTDAGRAALG